MASFLLKHKTKLLSMLGLILVAMTAYYFDHATIGGVIMAFTGVPLSSSDQAYRIALSNTKRWTPMMQLPAWCDEIGWIGGLSSDGVPRTVRVQDVNSKNLNATGSIIEMLAPTEFEGSLSMDIPLNNMLTAAPIHGTKQRRGLEARRTLSYMHIEVAPVSQAVEVQSDIIQTHLSKQKQKAAVQQLFKNGVEELSEWFKRYVGVQPYFATLVRYSHNLTDTEAGSPQKTKGSHPYFFVAGSGQVAYSATPATYEASIASAVGALTASASTRFSTRILDLMVQEAANKGIVPLANGMYRVHISEGQFYQLSTDEAFIEAFKFAADRGKDNTLIDGILKIPYRRCLLVVDPNLPGMRTSNDSDFNQAFATLASGGVQYGKSTYMDNPIDDSNRRVAILYGRSAIAGAYPGRLQFNTETWDYDAGQGTAGSMIFGFERGDIYNEGRTSFVKTASLACATYSPFTGNWTE